MRKKYLIFIMIILCLAIFTACNNGEISDPKDKDTARYQIENGGFETGDLSGWQQVSGTAFKSAGVTNDSFDSVYNGAVSYNKDGEYFYGRYNESAVGKMKSSVFEIAGSGYITFKLGAGKSVALTYISIVDAESGIELARFGNTMFNSTDYMQNAEDYREANLIPYVADLSKYKGHTAYILVVDDSTANWGFLTMDSFVTYYEDKPDTVAYYEAKDIKPIFPNKTVTPNALYNGDFKYNLNGWSVIGEDGCFKDEHINSNNRLSNRPDEDKVGVLRSGSFKVGGQNIMSFRLGATKHPEMTYLTIKEVGTNKEVIRTYSNRWKSSDEEKTHLYFVDLQDYKDKCLYIEVVDNSRGDWGLVTLEDIITFYSALPTVYDEIAIDLNQPMIKNPAYSAMRDFINPIINQIQDEDARITLEKTFYATIDGIKNNKGDWPTVLRYNDDGSIFCYTGDIHAMWLRDSSAQVLAYLQFMTIDEDVRLMVKGLLKKQFELIRRDPYANAFNPNGSVFERKFEIDSLCYPIWLAYEYYTITGDASIFDIFFKMTVNTIIDTFIAEQNHNDDNYRITNEGDRNAGLHEVNTASKLIWSGYRPSDDVCYYKFFIPGNMFAVATLEKISDIFTSIKPDATIAATAYSKANEIREAIERYGTYNHPKYGKIYAFEVNGMVDDANSMEGKLLMDAANIPSLISAPWLGFCAIDDEVYQNTRSFTLSDDNPYYYEGVYAKGIGDPHDMVGSSNNPHKDIPVPWHMSIAMQALTSLDYQEIERCVEYMTNTTGGTYVMHEAFNANNPTDYSRDYFTWPCALYAHTVITKILDVNLQ